MNLTVEYPSHLPDAMQLTPAEFEREAKIALAAKLFENGRLSSGMAAQLAGLGRVDFLHELARFKVSIINLDAEDLKADLDHA